MKVVLIIPPHVFLNDQKRNCSLGIMYIASVLEQNNYHVEMVDLRSTKECEWPEKIPEGDIYGFTAASSDYNMALKIAGLIKENYNACTVLGGSHATSLPEEVDKIFDKIVIGEGEHAILDLMQDFKNGVSKRIYQSSRIEDLDSIPYPARHLLPFDSVFSDKLVTHGNPATTLVTSRGCPYNCSFCANNKIWGQKIRFRSPSNVVGELKQIINNYGVKEFRFHDDTIGLNKKRVIDLCKKMEPLDIVWRAHTRVDTSSYDVLAAMRRAGCEEVGYGIESISQKVLDLNAKKTKLKDIYDALANAEKADMRTRLFFIIGLPGEEAGVADRTIEFLKKTKPAGVNLATLVPLPGSDLFENPSKYGIELHSTNYEDAVMTIGLGEGEKGQGFIFKHSHLSREELIEEREKILNFITEYNLALNQ